LRRTPFNALEPQRPLPDEASRLGAKGKKKEDRNPEFASLREPLRRIRPRLSHIKAEHVVERPDEEPFPYLIDMAILEAKSKALPIAVPPHVSDNSHHCGVGQLRCAY
jgi:hypothetical protein